MSTNLHQYSWYNNIAELEGLIRFHQRLYYDLNEPEISDSDFDAMWDRLKELSPDSPVLKERSQDKYGDEMPHLFPMGSLDKVKTIEELFAKFKGKRVIISSKIDGASVALRYSNRRLTIGLSRGRTETQKGKIVTPNVSQITGIPLSVNAEDLPEHFEIRGEAYICKSDFYGTMDQPGYEGMPDGYANPRNLASASLTCQDPRLVVSHKVRFLACKMVKKDDSRKTGFSDSQDFEQFSEWGFEVPANSALVVDDLEKLRKVVDEWDKRRAGLPYETDGIVIRLADAEEYNALGFSGVCPRGAVAFKFENQSAETTITDIQWAASRVGFVTPVAIFDEIILGGNSYTKCTLNNPTWMKDNGNPSVGARVRVARMNDVIPNVVEVVSPGTGDTKQPSECPSCGSTLAFAETGDGEGAKLKCFSDGCPAKIQGRILNALRRFEIKGMADSTLERIIGAGLVNDPWEILDLTQVGLVGAGFGKVESKNIVDSIKGIEVKASNLLASIGIESWGKRMFELLLTNGSPLFTEDKLLSGDFKYDELVAIKGVGPSKAKLLADSFAPDGYSRKFLSELLKRVKVTKKAGDMTKSAGGKLVGKSFCLSGSMPRGKKQIETDIVAAGGSVKDGISKDLSFLVAGEGSGSKSEKAIKYGIHIISEEQLYQMIGG